MVCNKLDIAFDIKQTLYILNSIQRDIITSVADKYKRVFKS